MLYVGGSIGYFQGDIRKLADDIGALRPTIFAGVPRVFERIYNGVMDQVRTHACVWGLWVLGGEASRGREGGKGTAAGFP